MIDLPKFKLSIRDPLYGLVQVTQPELSLLKTIPFTRMRWIKQMGLACLVFPGANHTRFEHSLGTMFVADKLVGALLDKLPNEFLRKNIQAIRFAALLHDLGHAPFSHVTEEFFRRNPRYLPAGRKSYDHEAYTEAVIQQNDRLRALCKKENIDLRFVSKLAAGRSHTLFDSLLSSSIDVDKIDYIMRDSYFCGLPYGRIDLSSLAEGITLTKSSLGDEVIAFEEKTRDIAEALLMARFYLMTTIHMHERNRAANQLLFRAMARAYDFVLKPATRRGLSDDVKQLVLDCLHFRWVDHDLITFLGDPFRKLKLSAFEADWEGFSSLKADTLQEIIQDMPSRPGKYGKRYFSYVLLNKVLQGRIPNLRHSISLAKLSPPTRYSLYVLHKLSPYTDYLNIFKRFIQKQKSCKGKRIYVDLTAPKLPEINTKIMVEKNTKNLFDVSSFARSLVSETANRLELSIYSYQKISRIPLRNLESLIRALCKIARRREIKQGRYVETDLILLVYYFLYRERMFFEGDTRFQAFFAVLFDKILKKSQKPFTELINLPSHYGDLNDYENYEIFRENGYPDFFSVKFAQDLDLLTEIGLIYTRSGPVRILGTGEYPKRYERRISRHGREYVKSDLLNRYPFVNVLRKKIRKALESESPLVNLGI